MRPDHRISLFLALILCLAASGVVQAQALKSGELRINQRTTGTQWLPDVATAADGRFVVVWEEGGDTTDPAKPVFVMARLFDATGKPRSGDIQVARHLRPYSLRAAVAMAPDGRFVVVWGGGTKNPGLVFGRRYAADGRPLGPRFPLARNSDYQREPDVAMAADGSFVAVWTQTVEPEDPDDVPADVFFRRFGPDGRPRGPEALAIGGYEEQSRARVALRPDGSFLVACSDFEYEGVFTDIEARLFAPSGAPLGEAIQVHDDYDLKGAQFEPSLAVAADGRFAIAWTDQDADVGTSTFDSTGVSIRFFAADGNPLGPERSPVNVFASGMQTGVALSALQTGGFLMLWTSGANQDGDEHGIFGRVFGADGTLRGREFRINLQRTGNQLAPALSVAPNGKGVAVWYGPDGDGTGIFARLIGRPGQGS